VRLYPRCWKYEYLLHPGNCPAVVLQLRSCQAVVHDEGHAVLASAVGFDKYESHHLCARLVVCWEGCILSNMTSMHATSVTIRTNEQGACDNRS
jgi:hypothetical protein